jgi:hypothetical protein
VKGPKTEAGRRTIALDRETVDAFMAHRQLVGDHGYVFTTPGGSRGPGGPLARSNFWRVGNRALTDAKLHTLWQEYGGLHFHDLRHTHATWLLARRVPLIAVANRLGHANPVITMMVYAHVDRLVERGELTAEDLGLEGDDRPITQKMPVAHGGCRWSCLPRTLGGGRRRRPLGEEGAELLLGEPPHALADLHRAEQALVLVDPAHRDLEPLGDLLGSKVGGHHRKPASSGAGWASALAGGL